MAKFALWGALLLGTAAFIHVWLDGYKFSASGQAIDDVRYVTLTITALGVSVGALVGAAAGALVSVVKRHGTHA